MGVTSTAVAAGASDVVPVDESARVPARRELQPEMGEDERRRFRVRSTATHAVWGLAFGYGVLHPLAMATFRWFELRGTAVGLEPIVRRAIESFGPAMLPMGLVFAVFSLVIGAMDGYYKSVVHFQRDDLVRQLEINQAYHRELEAQNTALRELEQIKRRMTQFLVHDLKNHVGCVLGYTNLLLKRARKNGWEQRDQNALITVSRQAARMEGAVRDVLELAKLEQKPHLDVRPLPAMEVLHEAITASAVGPGEGVVLVDDNVPLDLMVDCDPTLIVRVMANLVVNAVKHNGDDVTVTIGAYDGPRSAVFTCADTGHGIPDEIRDRLFDEFTSAAGEGEMTPSYGLGLAFCKAAVEAHGGRIWFESQRGVGTTFFFALPKRESDEPLDVRTTAAVRTRNGRSIT